MLIEHNGEVVKESEVKGEEEEGLTDRSLLNMKDIWDFINTVDVEEIKEVLDRQMEYNYTIAKEGIRGDYGANIGKVLLDMDGDNVKTRAKAMAAAGSDARMNGCELPVVINSGSGNQGITGIGTGHGICGGVERRKRKTLPCTCTFQSDSNP